MERSWYWRVALIVAVAVFSLYQLVPSWFYFKLPPEVRNGDAYDKSVPPWAPAARHHLNLGLDLQGGIHLAMGVDVGRRIEVKGEALDAIRKTVLDAYDQEMFAPGGAPAGALLFAFRDQVLRD